MRGVGGSFNFLLREKLQRVANTYTLMEQKFKMLLLQQKNWCTISKCLEGWAINPGRIKLSLPV